MKAIEVNHPLIEHKLSILRRKDIKSKDFRDMVKEIAIFLCYEAMRNIHLKEIDINTPVTKTKIGCLKEEDLVFVPILRAGIGMLNDIIEIIPNAKFGLIGISREETIFNPIHYYTKLPDNIENKEVFILDPVLATGNTALKAIEILKLRNVKKIKLLCIIATKKGIKMIEEKYHDVQIYCCHIDYLDKQGTIFPGLGDAGDLFFGTE